MTTSELERRLAAMLHEHAEEAMNDTRTEEQLDQLLADSSQRTGHRRTRVAAAAVVAVAAVAVLFAWVVGSGSRQAGPGPVSQEQRAEQTATGFVEAYTHFDRAGAASYVAPDAQLTLWTDAAGNDHWRRGNRWLQAAGVQMTLDGCSALWSAGPQTHVSCAFEFHALGSEQLGRGPYPDGTLTFTVRDGSIIDGTQDLAVNSNGFWDQMWVPFATWVTATHPADARQMYADWPDTRFPADGPRARKLWRTHVKEFVAARHAGGS